MFGSGDFEAKSTRNPVAALCSDLNFFHVVFHLCSSLLKGREPAKYLPRSCWVYFNGPVN
jgi:hypothetical protein